MSLSIAVFSDVICPWCYLGKRRLESALRQLGLDGTTIRGLPFELNPAMPPGGMARAEYRAAKFGAARADQLDREMTTRGAEDGVAFAFDRMERTPSTRNAHKLIAHATGEGRGGAVVEALFRAYFEEARDIGAEGVLLDVVVFGAAAPGAARAGAGAPPPDEAIGREVAALERRAAEIGVQGVPFFIVDEAWAVSGAQPAEQWIAALRERVARPAAE